MTTLWDKFKTAMRWVVADDDAAVAIVHAADTPEPERLLDAEGSTTSAPSAATDGVRVAGLRTTNLYYRHASAGDTSEVVLWLYDGDADEASDADRWFRWGTVSLSKDEDILDPFDLEGNWQRIAAEVTTAPADTVTMKVSPHTEPSNTD